MEWWRRTTYSYGTPGLPRGSRLEFVHGEGWTLHRPGIDPVKAILQPLAPASHGRHWRQWRITSGRESGRFIGKPSVSKRTQGIIQEGLPYVAGLALAGFAGWHIGRWSATLMRTGILNVGGSLIGGTKGWLGLAQIATATAAPPALTYAAGYLPGARYSSWAFGVATTAGTYWSHAKALWRGIQEPAKAVVDAFEGGYDPTWDPAFDPPGTLGGM